MSPRILFDAKRLGTTGLYAYRGKRKEVLRIILSGFAHTRTVVTAPGAIRFKPFRHLKPPSRFSGGDLW
jgi:hypothetical protein